MTSKPIVNAEEEQYLQILRDIRDHGVDQDVERTGVGTREVFGRTMRFDLSDGRMPIFTSKTVFWKTAFKEMLWMLSGGRNIQQLLEQNVSIWSDWPHKSYVETTGDKITIKEFEQRILADNAFAAKWGDLGDGIYGNGWREWPTYEAAPYCMEGEKLFRRGPNVDQIQQVLHSIRNNPGSRRHIFTAWNPPLLGGMALPPCHMVYQFQVADGKLSLALFQRSCDAFAGVPFNCASAALVLRLFAQHTGYQPGELVWMGSCVHYYTNQADAVATQLLNDPRPFPTLTIAPQASLFEQTIADFTLEGYNPHGKISAPIAV